MKAPIFSSCAALLALLLIVSDAAAISVPSEQTKTSVVAEIGGYSDIYIVLQDVSGEINITASGEKSGWVSFGTDGAAYYAVHPSLAGILHVRISVPSDAFLGKYEIRLLANGTGIADITIVTTLQQDAIRVLEENVKTLRELADVNTKISEINNRLADIKQRINSTEDSIKTLADAQMELKSIQNETSKLSAKIDELKVTSQSTGITGLMFADLPMSLAAGFVAGAAIVLSLSNRGRVKSGFRRT